MSRVGKLPIEIPEGVRGTVKDDVLKISGSKGSLEKKLIQGVSLNIEEGKISLVKKGSLSKASFGTMRALIANMAVGVSKGWGKTLELVGAGYKAELSGNTLTLMVGYSHPVKIEAPEGISFKIEKTDITVEGIDKEVVGQTAAKIRAVRPPEPYKGKGIKYKDEVVRRKAGKTAKAQT